MKKILLLLIGLTIISCSSDDDTRTTDPFIGTWIKSYPVTENGIEYNIAETYIITPDPECPYSCGDYIYTIGDDDGGIDDRATQNGRFSIFGVDINSPITADFNLLNQSYSLSKNLQNGLSEEYTLQIRFESDFNSFEILNECDEYDEDEEYCGVFYIRQ